jgi:hypothetical protein
MGERLETGAVQVDVELRERARHHRWTAAALEWEAREMLR